MNQVSINIGITSANKMNYLMWLFSRLCINISGVNVFNLYPDCHEDYQKCDGYIFTGGEDINPSLYHQKNRHSININKNRDEMELRIAMHAIQHCKPILGICRGAQMINVVKGGSLYQNAGEVYESFVPTQSLLGKIFIRRKITISKPSLIYENLRVNELRVNSLHHQAIHLLGEGLRVTAVDEYGMAQVIECDEPDSAKILGVQWHPEFMFYSTKQRKLFAWLVNCCISQIA